jgi:hypothetical protein
MALVLVVRCSSGRSSEAGGPELVGGRALRFDFFTVPYSSCIKNTVTTFVVFLIVALTAAEVGIRLDGSEAARGGGRFRPPTALPTRRLGADVEDVVSAVR